MQSMVQRAWTMESLSSACSLLHHLVWPIGKCQAFLNTWNTRHMALMNQTLEITCVTTDSALILEISFCVIYVVLARINISFVLYRTIMALWKARSLSTELKVQLAEEQSQTNSLQSEDSGIFVGIEDAKSLQMTEVFSTTISTNVSSVDLYRPWQI